MTLETFENLMRVIEKRIRHATRCGRWADAAAAVTEKHALIERYHAEQQGESK
jgi:hypothetical protein